MSHAWIRKTFARKGGKGLGKQYKQEKQEVEALERQ